MWRKRFAAFCPRTFLTVHKFKRFASHLVRQLRFSLLCAFLLCLIAIFVIGTRFIAVWQSCPVSFLLSNRSLGQFVVPASQIQPLYCKNEPEFNCDSVHFDHLAVLSSWPPRHCGIAQFASSLTKSIQQLCGSHVTIGIFALHDMTHKINFSDKNIAFVIRSSMVEDYYVAANLINQRFNVVLVQHEYGLFGGTQVDYLSDLLIRLHPEIRVIMTLHTISNAISVHLKGLIQYYSLRVNKFVSVSAEGCRELSSSYGIPTQACVRIPHGAPSFRSLNRTWAKAQLGLSDKLVLLTFGLLTPNKGLHVAIQAVGFIAQVLPSVVYVIAGAHSHSRNRCAVTGKACVFQQVDQLAHFSSWTSSIYQKYLTFRIC